MDLVRVFEIYTGNIVVLPSQLLWVYKCDCLYCLAKIIPLYAQAASGFYGFNGHSSKMISGFWVGAYDIYDPFRDKNSSAS